MIKIDNKKFYCAVDTKTNKVVKFTESYQEILKFVTKENLSSGKAKYKIVVEN